MRSNMQARNVQCVVYFALPLGASGGRIPGKKAQRANASTWWGMLPHGHVDACPLAIVGRHGHDEGEQGLHNANWERWTLNSLVSLPKQLPYDLV